MWEHGHTEGEARAVHQTEEGRFPTEAPSHRGHRLLVAPSLDSEPAPRTPLSGVLGSTLPWPQHPRVQTQPLVLTPL